MADCEFDPVTAARTQGEDMVRPGKTRYLTATFVTQGKQRQTTRSISEGWCVKGNRGGAGQRRPCSTTLPFCGYRFRFSILRGPQLGLAGVFVNRMQQGPGGVRNRYFAAQDFVAIHIVAIHGAVAALIGLNHSAIQADTGENAVRARVRQYLGIQLDVGGSGGVATDGTSRDSGIAAEFEFVAQKTM